MSSRGDRQHLVEAVETRRRRPRRPAPVPPGPRLSCSGLDHGRCGGDRVQRRRPVEQECPPGLHRGVPGPRPGATGRPACRCRGELGDLLCAGRQRGRQVLPSQALFEQRLAGGLPQTQQRIEIAGDRGQPLMLRRLLGEASSAAETVAPPDDSTGRLRLLRTVSTGAGWRCRGRAAARFSVSCAARIPAAVTAPWPARPVAGDRRTAHRARVAIDQLGRQFRRHPGDPRLDQRLPAVDGRLMRSVASAAAADRRREVRLQIGHRPGRAQHDLRRGQLLAAGRQQVPGGPGAVDPRLELGDPGRQSGQPLLDIDRGDLVPMVPLPGPGQQGEIALLLGRFGDRRR